MSTKITVNETTLFKCTNLDHAHDLLERLNVSKRAIADNLYMLNQYIVNSGSVYIKVVNQSLWSYGPEEYFRTTMHKALNYTPNGSVKYNGVRILSS